MAAGYPIMLLSGITGCSGVLQKGQGIVAFGAGVAEIGLLVQRFALGRLSKAGKILMDDGLKLDISHPINLTCNYEKKTQS